MTDKSPPTLSDTLEKIENIVKQLEQSDSCLEDSLQRFEQGTILINQALQALQSAEEKVQLLIEQNDKTITTPFGATGSEDRGE